MTTSGRVLETGEPLELDTVVSALERAFRVAVGPRTTVRRTRLDTFDRRLAAAGLVLEQRVTGADRRLVLTHADGGTVVAAQTTAVEWPALSDALDESPVRAAVAPVTDIRALMVQDEQQRRMRRLELRNDDDKLVVRVAVEIPVAGPPVAEPAPATTVTTVAVEALRGYAADGRRAGRLLASLGLREAGVPLVVEAPAPEPTVDRADRAAPAALLLVDELGDFLTAMQQNLPGLLDDVDTEFLHDFRVAVRRSRATLKLGRSVLPEAWRATWEPAFKWLGDLTTPVRDLDVYVLELPQLSGWLVGADAADLAPFVTHLRRRRAIARRTLVRGLRSARYRSLVASFEQVLAEVAAAPQPRRALTAGELADKQIRRTSNRVIELGRAITAASPAEDLHTLRKRAKELRYAIEVFEPVIDPADRKRAIADLKGLQDVLGRFQDSEVQRQSLRGFAQEMIASGSAADAVLAMGELVGHLDAEQDRARAEFEAAFARFVRPASLTRLRRLGGRT
jgi:CHAD domain-containing protein